MLQANCHICGKAFTSAQATTYSKDYKGYCHVMCIMKDMPKQEKIDLLYRVMQEKIQFRNDALEQYEEERKSLSELFNEVRNNG